MIKIGSNISVVKKALRKMQTGQMSAYVSALNKTAFDVRDMERYEMEKVFDRPTPYTLNSLYTQYARMSRPYAEVIVKKSASIYHYIKPEIHGGNRLKKRFEYMLTRIGILGSNELTVPAGGARFDQYGNVSRGQYVEILSQLQAFYLAGSQQNETANSRKRNIAKHYKARYFVARKGESRVGGGSWKNGEKIQHLKSGIWARYKTAYGSSIRPVFFFVKSARYQKRYDFYGVAQKTAEKRFPPQYQRALEKFALKELDTTKTGTKWY